MVLMNKPTTVTQNEITDAISDLHCSKGHTECTGHSCMVKAQILALRIDENLLYDGQEIRGEIAHAARAAAAAAIGADNAAKAAEKAVEQAQVAVKKAEAAEARIEDGIKPQGWGRVAVMIGGPSVCVLAIIATIWRAMGWIGG